MTRHTSSFANDPTGLSTQHALPLATVLARNSKNLGNNLYTKMPSSDAPTAAAAAASNGETVAQRIAAMEQSTLVQLVEVYGFSQDAAVQAVDIVGPDVQDCCAFIINTGLGQDQGGPVVPKDDCPHLEKHFLLSLSQLGDSFDPSNTTCSHFQDSTSTGKSGGLGSAKIEVDNDTGACPSKENWLCLECGVLRCSRYVNGHGLHHWEATKANDTEENPKVGHCIGLSLSDFSVWCYQCESYLKHSSLYPLLEKMEELKFRDNKDGEKDLKPAAKSSE